MASQLRGKYEVKNERMEQYLWISKFLLGGFKRIQVTHVPKSENEMTDALANLGTNALYQCNVELSVMDQPSILGTVVTTIDQQVEPSWITPIAEYLRNGVLLWNRIEAIKVNARVARYSLMNRVLYWCSFSGLYLRCLPKGEAERVLKQAHQGVCGTHIEGRTLCHQIVTQGYYWPIMK